MPGRGRALPALLALVAVVLGIALWLSGRFVPAAQLGTAPAFDPGDRPFRLLAHPLSTSPSEEIEVRGVGLDGQYRSTVGGPLPHRIASAFRVPKDGRLWFGLNRSGAGEGPASVSVRAVVDGEEHLLIEKELEPDPAAWEDYTLDLSPFSGREIYLELAAWGAGEGALVHWSNLFVGPPRDERPDVFVFLLDTLRPDHLSCYGYERETTPHIDAFAAEGVRFENAFSAAPWTDPSIAALFTGLHPSDLWEPGLHEDIIKKVLPDGVRTLAELLADEGYFTVAASDHPGIRATRFGRGFDVFNHMYAALGPMDGWRQTPTETVLEELRGLLHQRRPGGRLFYVHLIYPHRPYAAPAPFATEFGPPAVGETEAEREGMINMYDGEIRRTDELLGTFFADLRAAGVDRSSIQVILSDHGEGFWEHDGLEEHGNSLYNELLRIPLILRAPGRLPAGRSVTDLVGIVDVLPTLLDLVGAEAPEHCRGTSLLDTLAGEARPGRLLLGEFPHSSIVQGRALQSLEEKLIDSGLEDAVLEYFRLSGDPGELDNVYSDSDERPRRLLSLLSAIERLTDVDSSTTFEPPEDMLEALEALGYVD